MPKLTEDTGEMIWQNRTIKKPTGSCLWLTGGITALLGIAVILVLVISSPSKEELEQKTQQDIRSGQICVNKGLTWAMEDLVKERLNDPDSFQYENGIILPDSNDRSRYLYRMNFRAKNGFGAYIRMEAYASLQYETCKVLEFYVVGG